MREALDEASADELGQWRELTRLAMSVPELRARALDEYLRSVGMVTELLAKRVGRDPGDFAVRTLAGAVVGIGMSVMMMAMEDPEADIAALMDAGLARLEEGLPL
jgi:hypothetical protein